MKRQTDYWKIIPACFMMGLVTIYNSEVTTLALWQIKSTVITVLVFCQIKSIATVTLVFVSYPCNVCLAYLEYGILCQKPNTTKEGIMITEVNMERRLFGETVLQKSKSGFFSATDLVTAGNRWRNAKRQGVFSLHGWLQYKSTIEFIEELEAKFGKVICKGQKTWIHPFLFIDLALALSPKLKIETYSWLYDHLLQNRNDSGDSYKLMSGALYAHHGCKRTFPRLMASVSLKIQDLCGVHDWQQATEAQLKERIQIHDDISIHADVLHDNEQAVRMALIHHKKKKMAEGLGI